MHRPSGINTAEPRPYEAAHRKIAREAAAEGFVLLKNNGSALPLSAGEKIAVYGAGAVYTVKGGSGSGDVNSREVVSIADGLRAAGAAVVNESWHDELKREYEASRLARRDAIWAKVDAGEQFFYAAVSTPFVIPEGPDPVKEDADTAVYVISRSAGEGADRRNAPGDYQLTDRERSFITTLRAMYGKLVILINSGSLIDLSFIEGSQAEAVLYICQPGMEAGNAVADVLFGKVTPSGKLTDTWPLCYEDLPNAATFSYLTGPDTEIYHEGIYVGYRYFDTFEVPVLYPFGYGLSYTTFEMEPAGLTIRPAAGAPEINVRVKVTNTGSVPGKEVVQIYASCPGSRLDKEYRRLAGFRKTGLLSPGEMETVDIRIPLYDLASFDEDAAAWVLEAGDIILYAGSDLGSAKPFDAVTVTGETVFSKTAHICPQKQAFEEKRSDAARTTLRREKDLALIRRSGTQIRPEDVITGTPVYGPGYGDTGEETEAFVDSLPLEKLILLATGDITARYGSTIGSAGTRVPGSAAQTSACAVGLGLPDLVLADGPAGLRLSAKYQMVDGVPVKAPLEQAMENGFFDRSGKALDGETWYQYTTAIPVGTLLAQTWDPEILKKCGCLIGEEMNEFGVELWLAPGMNIHRNPLCGRNFEYYSEDPLLTGAIAAAMTEGVQSMPHCGVTIKHFACNSQEFNRKGSDSVLTERALREIYLKAFERVIRGSRPVSIMTSYNLVNGVHAANSYDLCTMAARCEWGFDGMIMTDWTTTRDDPSCTASGCMYAGNDIIMPGEPADHEDIRRALDDGRLDIRDLKRSVARTVRCIRAMTD